MVSPLRFSGLFLLMGVLFPGRVLFAQIEVNELAILQSVQYYQSRTNDSLPERTANLSFKFKGTIGRYFSTIEKGKWVVEFVNASIEQEPSVSKFGVPFEDINITKIRENIQVAEGMTPTMTDILRVEITMQDGYRPAVDLSSNNLFVYLKATWSKDSVVDPDIKKHRSNMLKYSVIGV